MRVSHKKEILYILHFQIMAASSKVVVLTYSETPYIHEWDYIYFLVTHFVTRSMLTLREKISLRWWPFPLSRLLKVSILKPLLAATPTSSTKLYKQTKPPEVEDCKTYQIEAWFVRDITPIGSQKSCSTRWFLPCGRKLDPHAWMDSQRLDRGRAPEVCL